MTEHEARERCAKLAAEDPERTTHSWVPRRDDVGNWSIVKLAFPSPGSEVTDASTAEEVQGLKEDPRTSLCRNAGAGYGG